MKLRIVIIEDEKHTAKDLAATIHTIDKEIEILPFLHSVEEAIFFLSQKPEVDLIFSDIDLGDGLSFDVFSATEVYTPIIFCTAYQEYMLRAFKSYGIEYILKPFSQKDIEQALLKFLALKKNFNQDSRLLDKQNEFVLSQTLKKDIAILANKGDKIVPIDSNDIAYVVIENEICVLYTFSKNRYHLSEKLETLEQRLPPSFFRVNRQILINRKAVVSVSRHFNQKLRINPSVPYHEEILVGKLKVTAFLTWLSGAESA